MEDTFAITSIVNYVRMVWKDLLRLDRSRNKWFWVYKRSTYYFVDLLL
jgi:hypothetical protein